jgi:hypothetical protein
MFSSFEEKSDKSFNPIAFGIIYSFKILIDNFSTTILNPDFIAYSSTSLLTIAVHATKYGNFFFC